MPLIVRPQKEYAMFEHFFGFRHVLKPLRYRDETHLLSLLNDKVIAPAETIGPASRRATELMAGVHRDRSIHRRFTT